MKFKSLFLLILSLITGLSLVDTRTASAGRPILKTVPKNVVCPGSKCPVVGGRTYAGTTIPADVLQKMNERIDQGTATVGDYLLVAYDSAQKQDFATSESRYLQALELATKTQDLDGQAAAHQGLAGVYTKIGKSNLGSSHLRNAGALYQTLGNSQRSNEVRLQLRKIQFQQIKVQPVTGN